MDASVATGAGGSSSAQPSPLCVASLKSIPPPDAAAVPTREWAINNARTTLPDSYPLANLGVGAQYVGDIDLNATDSDGAHYFNWNDSSSAKPQHGFLKVKADWSLAWQVTVPDSAVRVYVPSANKKGEVAIVGTANETADGAAYTAKYTADGSMAWSAQFRPRPSFYTQGLATSTAEDGSVISASYANDGSNNYIIDLIRYGSDGTTLWTRGYCVGNSGDPPKSIVTDSAGDIYFSMGDTVFAFSADGTPMFSSSVLGGLDVLSLSSDESALFALAKPLGVGNKPVLTKIDSKTGATDWTAHFATTNSLAVNEVLSFVVTPDGLYILGLMNDSFQFCARIDEQGSELWLREFAVSPHDPGGTSELLFLDSRGATTDGGASDAGARLDGGQVTSPGGGSLVLVTTSVTARRLGLDGTPLSF